MRGNLRILLIFAFFTSVAISMASRPAASYAVGNIHIIIVRSTTDPSLKEGGEIWKERLEETLATGKTPNFGTFGVFGALEPAFEQGGLGKYDVATYRVLEGQEAAPNNIREVCRNVSQKAGSDDAIMCIIMSHGTTIKENNVITHGLSPIATSKDNLDLGRIGIRRGTILNELEVRPHRLVLLITDSCASVAPDNDDTPPPFACAPPEPEIAAFPKEATYLKKFLQEAHGEVNVNSCDYGQRVELIRKCPVDEFKGSLFINAFCRFATNGFYLDSELNPDDFYKLLRIEHEREVLEYNAARSRNRQDRLTRFNGSQPVNSSSSIFSSLEEIQTYYKNRKQKISNSGEFGIGMRTFLDFAGNLKTITIKGIEYRFRWAPPGSFLWGYDSPTLIKFPYGFWILETETTQAMWKSVMNNNPSTFSPSGAQREKVKSFVSDDLPVESVSWNDCQRFVARLNDLGVAPVGYRFSLPTWAQWYYTIDGGRMRDLDEPIDDHGNFNSKSPFPVGYSRPNRWGIMDMRGNVAEFLQDRHGGGTELTSQYLTAPLGLRSSQGTLSAVGGSFQTSGDATQLVSASDSFDDVGFRLVLVPENPGSSNP